jgi:nitrate/nitrite-specific signal transduction histidine kinase
MKDLLRGVEILTAIELERANEEYGDKFNSMHEGYAVIMEEVQEAKEELDRAEQKLKLLWGAIRRDEYPAEAIQMLHHYAKLVACEAIQVAAMGTKFMNSFK